MYFYHAPRRLNVSATAMSHAAARETIQGTLSDGVYTDEMRMVLNDKQLSFFTQTSYQKVKGTIEKIIMGRTDNRIVFSLIQSINSVA